MRANPEQGLRALPAAREGSSHPLIITTYLVKSACYRQRAMHLILKSKIIILKFCFADPEPGLCVSQQRAKDLLIR